MDDLIIATKEIPDVKSTLLDERNIPKGSSRLIKYREMNINSIKSTVRNLRLEGYDISASEKDQVDGILVTRGMKDQVDGILVTRGMKDQVLSA